MHWLNASIFFTVLGLVNVGYAVFCIVKSVRGSDGSEPDIFGGWLIFLAGCVNLTTAYVRWNEFGLRELPLTACLLTAGCVNLVTARTVWISSRCRTGDSKLDKRSNGVIPVLPIYRVPDEHERASREAETAANFSTLTKTDSIATEQG